MGWANQFQINGGVIRDPPKNNPLTKISKGSKQVLFDEESVQSPSQHCITNPPIMPPRLLSVHRDVN